MKKLISVLISIAILSAGYAFASSPKVDATVKNAIYKYRHGNYSGCMQDLERYTLKKQTALSYYYLAMAYTKTGSKEKAIESYSNAIKYAKQEKNDKLKRYAILGKEKVENPAAFDDENSYDEIMVLIKDKNKLPEDLIEDREKKHLEYMRNEMNSGVNLSY